MYAWIKLYKHRNICVYAAGGGTGASDGAVDRRSAPHPPGGPPRAAAAPLCGRPHDPGLLPENSPLHLHPTPLSSPLSISTTPCQIAGETRPSIEKETSNSLRKIP